LGQLENVHHLAVLPLVGLNHYESNIAAIHRFSQQRRQGTKVGPVDAKGQKMVERDQRPAMFGHGILVFVWADPNPVYLPSDPVMARLGADAAHADDGTEVPALDLPHAVMDPEAAVWARVAAMSPLVDEYPHGVSIGFRD